MAINGIGTTTPSTSPSITPKTDIDKNAFLRLFTKQLQYQDPLNPMDATAFTTQLAQFTSLEQLYNVNSNLTSMITAQKSLLTSTSASLIGKQVTMNDGSTAKVTGVSFDGTNTNIMLDSNKSVLFTDIKQISA
ncbi:MAG: flagellar hook capping protein [Desulfobacca sp.]|nr:flagellar hook capping protein [Desulfobacca sp.]